MEEPIEFTPEEIPPQTVLQYEPPRKKRKPFISAHSVKLIIASILSTLVIVAILGAVVWHHRAEIFKYFASDYAAKTLAAEGSVQPDSLSLGDASATAPAEDLASFFSDQTLVENSVAKANTAVVAITISEQVPKYTTTYQNISPFGDGIGPQIQVPQQEQTGTQEQEVGSGSGFIISSDGMIVTNKHVVEDKDAKYTVYLSNGKKYDATVLARDAVLDVAIVKIDATGLPYLTLGDSDALKLGQSVIAIGNALGQFQNTVSLGVVSGLSRSIVAGDEGTTEDLDHVIQTDAAINPGNSGGPLLDLNGNVVGMDTAIVEGSQSVGFALPIDALKTVINSVEKTGKIIRPYIGIRYEEITPDMQDAKKLSVDYGVLVGPGENPATEPAVIPGSPAAKAGLKDGDIILDVNGQTLDANSDFSEIIRDQAVGSTVTLMVLTGTTQHTVKVTLEAAPQ